MVGTESCRLYLVEDGVVLVVVACRLAREQRSRGLLSASRVVLRLAHSGVSVRLAIVGDGSVRSFVDEEAARADELDASRCVVFLTGGLLDPRVAYAAADVVLGMGGSALRGMAFGKSLIVQGEARTRAIWRRLVVERCRFEHASRTLVRIYENAVGGDHMPTIEEVLRVRGVTMHNAGRRWARQRWRVSQDDFNTIEAQNNVESWELL